MSKQRRTPRRTTRSREDRRATRTLPWLLAGGLAFIPSFLPVENAQAADPELTIVGGGGGGGGGNVAAGSGTSAGTGGGGGGGAGQGNLYNDNGGGGAGHGSSGNMGSGSGGASGQANGGKGGGEGTHAQAGAANINGGSPAGGAAGATANSSVFGGGGGGEGFNSIDNAVVSGGDGGKGVFQANSIVNPGDYGGNGGAGGGASAGSISESSYNGITISGGGGGGGGAVSSLSYTGVPGALSGGKGGAGGGASLKLGDAARSITSSEAVYVTGGAGGGGAGLSWSSHAATSVSAGSGGAGGAAVLSGSALDLTITATGPGDALVVGGGSGGFGGAAGIGSFTAADGGAGAQGGGANLEIGNLKVDGTRKTTFKGGFGGSGGISDMHSAASGGDGGQGGATVVKLQSLKSGGEVSIFGGNGGSGGAGKMASGSGSGLGGEGAQAGSVNVRVESDMDVAVLTMQSGFGGSGGTATDGGAAGNGGSGGDASLYVGGNLSVASDFLLKNDNYNGHAGNGSVGDLGGDGGHSGHTSLTVKGDLRLSGSSSSINAGEAGSRGFGGGSGRGQAGDGGNLTLEAGRLVLDGAELNITGGKNSSNPSGSGRAGSLTLTLETLATEGSGTKELIFTKHEGEFNLGVTELLVGAATTVKITGGSAANGLAALTPRSLSFGNKKLWQDGGISSTGYNLQLDSGLDAHNQFDFTHNLNVYGQGHSYTALDSSRNLNLAGKTLNFYVPVDIAEAASANAAMFTLDNASAITDLAGASAALHLAEELTNIQTAGEKIYLLYASNGLYDAGNSINGTLYSAPVGLTAYEFKFLLENNDSIYAEFLGIRQLNASLYSNVGQYAAASISGMRHGAARPFVSSVQGLALTPFGQPLPQRVSEAPQELVTAAGPSSLASPWRATARAQGGYWNYDKRGGYDGYDLKLYSGLGSIDYNWESFRLGLALNVGNLDQDFDSNKASADTDFGQASLYAAWARGDFRLAGAFTFGTGSVDLSRELSGTSLSGDGDYDLNWYGLSLAAAHDFALGDFVLTPSLSLAWLRLHNDSFNEKFSDGSRIHYNSDNHDSFELGAQLMAARSFTLESGRSLTPYLGLGLGWELGDRNTSLSGSTVNAPSPYNSLGFTGKDRDTARVRFDLSAGVDFALSENFSLGLAYQGGLATGMNSHQGMLNFKFTW